MSNVIAFPKRPDTRPPPMATPMPPAWAMLHLDTFFDLDRWQVSQRGNRYLRLDGYCITTFPARVGWKWCIAGDAKHRPLWSAGTLDTERLARADAWEWLVKLAEAEGR